MAVKCRNTSCVGGTDMRAVGVRDNKAWVKDNVKLTPKRAIQAKCAECMSNYEDGRQDCMMKDCPLYPWMPYNLLKGKKPVGERRAGPGKDQMKKVHEDGEGT